MDKTIYGRSPYEKHAAASRERITAMRNKKSYEDYKVRTSQERYEPPSTTQYSTNTKQDTFTGGGLSSPSQRGYPSDRLYSTTSPKKKNQLNNQSGNMVLHSPSHHGSSRSSPSQRRYAGSHHFQQQQQQQAPRYRQHSLNDQVDDLDDSMKQESEKLNFISIKNDPETLLQQLKSSIFQEKQSNHDFKKRLKIVQDQHAAQLVEAESRIKAKYENQILDLEATVSRLQHQLKMTTVSLRSTQRDHQKLQSTMDAIVALAAPMAMTSTTSSSTKHQPTVVVEEEEEEESPPKRLRSLEHGASRSFHEGRPVTPKVPLPEHQRHISLSPLNKNASLPSLS